jgi:hypothetical protein
MKNVAILLVIGAVIASGFAVAAVPTTPNQTPRQTFDDELDQFLTTRDGVNYLGALSVDITQQNVSIAQSFIPQKDVITRVQLLMAKNSTASAPCTCDIRENLTGTALATVQVTPDQFKPFDPTNLSADENLTWVEFNFFSVWVTPGTTYYLVVYTANITDNFYVWAGNSTNGYLNGSAYYSTTDGATWFNMSDSDTCFQTYGVHETTLSITVGKNLLGPSFTIKNTGNYTAGNVASNVTVTGGILGLIHSFSFKYFDLPQNNQKTVLTPFTLGFGSVKIVETVTAVNVKDQVVQVDATLFLFIMMVK